MNQSQSQSGDRVARAVLSAYAKLPQNGKPKKRDNGHSEWTVLAGFCVCEEDEGEESWRVECVSLGTGLRCLPHAKSPPRGDVLHDSHAEVVARRGFKLFLLNQIRIAGALEDGDGAKTMLERDYESGRWKLRKEVKVAMYISTLPCGDASTYALSLLAPPTSAEGTSFDHTPPSSAPSTLLATTLGLQTLRTPISTTTPQVHRGRISYATLGTLRTKPGRIDSPPSTSHSCSDKIAMWLKLGLQGGLLSSLMEKVGLDILVFGGVEVEQEGRMKEEVRRAVVGRLEGWVDRHGDELEIMVTRSEFSGAKIPSADEDGVELASCPESLSYIHNLGAEVIVNGIRQGASSKRKTNERLSAKSRSRICKLGLYNRFAEVMSTPNDSPPPETYFEAKHMKSSEWYQSAKAGLRAPGAPFEGWLVSGKEFESFRVDGQLRQKDPWDV